MGLRRAKHVILINQLIINVIITRHPMSSSKEENKANEPLLTMDLAGDSVRKA